jgi:hypothetical protein
MVNGMMKVVAKVNVMRTCFLAALGFFIAFGSSQSISGTLRGNRGDCHTRAIAELQRLSVHGYAIYQAMGDKKQFLNWVTCEDVQTELSTGVHESVHLLTAEKDAYPLIAGDLVRRPHEVSRFFSPKEIAKSFDARDAYVQSYLGPKGASSKDDFMYLLDELNAYSHDLDAAIALVPLQLHDREVDRRDGLAALMTFVMRYVETAKKAKPATWQGLQHSEPKKAIQALWSQAETTLASSCGLPAFGLHDRDYIAYLCENKNAGALAELLERAPVCPAECLTPATTSSTLSHPAR